MDALGKKVLLLTVVAVSLSLLSGCVDYKKKYNALNVEHQNLQGLYDNCKATLDSSSSEKEQLASKLAESEQTIEEMKKQVSEKKKTPGEASGFGDYDVSLNAAEGTITVTLPETILFDSGKAALKGSASRDLDHISSVLKEKYGGRTVDVIGHTDSDPIKKSNWKDNWELSSERALSVVRQLNSDGIPEGKLRAIGCGSGRPIAPNTSASGKARNRRVEIVVHMK